MNTFTLQLSWAISKGRTTSGFPICRLDGPVDGHSMRFRCMGGGYDLIGTVFGDWLEHAFQQRLYALAAAGKSFAIYGMTYIAYSDRVQLDGACGYASIMLIAGAIGISCSEIRSKRGILTGWMCTDYGSAEALRVARS